MDVELGNEPFRYHEPQHNTSNFKSVRTSGEYENTYNGNIIENNGRLSCQFYY
jgi:hypothetical protein